jgi:hypothetical protein
VDVVSPFARTHLQLVVIEVQQRGDALTEGRDVVVVDNCDFALQDAACSRSASGTMC